MFNTIEWATKEEMEAYAWYGFAMQEVQSIEFMLLTMVVALDAENNNKGSGSNYLNSLFSKYSRLDLRRLYKQIIKYTTLPNDFEKKFERVVEVRNELAHGLFWPKRSGKRDSTSTETIRELMKVASLFSNFSSVVELAQISLLQSLNINKNDAEIMVRELDGKDL